MSLITTVLLAIPISAFCYYQNNTFTLTKLNINCGLEGKLRIIQLSDLHSKEFGRDNEKLINKIIEQNPDLIVTTGDLIDSSLKNMDKIIDFLSKLNKRIPVIYIPGNNEMRSGKLSEIILRLKENKIITLNNEIIDLNIKSNTVNILGFAEKQEDTSKFFINKAKSTYGYKWSDELLKKLESKKGVKIVLSHYPENFEMVNSKNYSQYGFHVMFSGHAHGGQFILPIVGGLFAPGQGVLPKYYSGLYEGKNHSKLIVSRGLGNSGFPLRLFNRPDIVIVDIE